MTAKMLKDIEPGETFTLSKTGSARALWKLYTYGNEIAGQKVWVQNVKGNRTKILTENTVVYKP